MITHPSLEYNRWLKYGIVHIIRILLLVKLYIFRTHTYNAEGYPPLTHPIKKSHISAALSGHYRARTYDILLVRQALSQLS